MPCIALHSACCLCCLSCPVLPVLRAMPCCLTYSFVLPCKYCHAEALYMHKLLNNKAMATTPLPPGGHWPTRINLNPVSAKYYTPKFYADYYTNTHPRRLPVLLIKPLHYNLAYPPLCHG